MSSRSRREASATVAVAGPASGSRDAVAGIPHLLGAGAIVVALFIGSGLLFSLRWQRDALQDVTSQPGGWPGAILLVAAGAVVHEVLHALGWSLGARVPWRSISWRPTWRVMGFATRVDVAIPVRAYRLGSVLPALALSVLPIALGIATGAGLLVLWGLFFFLECFTDLAALLATLGLPSHARVIGHPDRIGCRVIADAGTV